MNCDVTKPSIYTEPDAGLAIIAKKPSREMNAMDSTSFLLLVKEIGRLQYISQFKIPTIRQRREC